VAVSVAPNSGSALTQTFTFTYSDADGAAALKTGEAIFGGSLTLANDCYLIYRPAHGLYLGNDAGGNYVAGSPIPPGGSGTLSNHQCSVTVSGGSWASTTSNSLVLTLPVTFAPGFTGAKNIYMRTYSNTNLTSGWVLKGGWTP
jgi:hypothetical protein